jgi:hypothetical protein
MRPPMTTWRCMVQGIMALASQVHKSSTTCTVSAQGSSGYTVVTTGQNYTVRPGSATNGITYE